VSHQEVIGCKIADHAETRRSRRVARHVSAARSRHPEPREEALPVKVRGFVAPIVGAMPPLPIARLPIGTARGGVAPPKKRHCPKPGANCRGSATIGRAPTARAVPPSGETRGRHEDQGQIKPCEELMSAKRCAGLRILKILSNGESGESGRAKLLNQKAAPNDSDLLKALLSMPTLDDCCWKTNQTKSRSEYQKPIILISGVIHNTPTNFRKILKTETSNSREACPRHN
jgi:hypothetical protein